MNSYDTFKILQFFGNEPLTEQDRVANEFDPIIGGVIRRGIPVYRKSTPHYLNAWDRGFYLKTLLVELPLAEYADSLGQREGIFYIQDFGETKQLDNFGTPLILPVLVAYILINRPVFQPVAGETRQACIDRLARRKRAMAHELCFAAQFAREYDFGADIDDQITGDPTEADENRLLCPHHIIEELLHGLEIATGAQVNQATGFLHVESVEFRNTFYREVYENYCVPQSVCHQTTLSYYDIVTDRRMFQFEVQAMLEQAFRGGSPNSSHDIKACLRNPNCAQRDALLDLIEQIRARFPGLTVETAEMMLCRIIDRPHD